MTLERVRCDIESRSESYTASETQIVTLLCDPAASFFYHLKAVEPRCIMIAAVPQQTEQFVAECFLFFPLFFFFFPQLTLRTTSRALSSALIQGNSSPLPPVIETFLSEEKVSVL